MSSSASTDVSSVVGDFWAGIRQPDLAPLVSSTRDRILSVCPAIDTFSFDLVEEEGAVTGTSGTETPVVSVEAGTPRPVVAAWNENKLVGLFVFVPGVQCGAAVGDVSIAVRDFKACYLPVEGDDKCTAGTHVGPRVKRIYSSSGDPLVTIAVPASSPTPKQVFSRPILEKAEFIHLPFGSHYFERLLTLRMEPRVWKALFELFPGPQVFAQSPLQPLLTTPSLQMRPENIPSTTAAPSVESVSSAPFRTPLGADGQPGQPYQFPGRSSQRDGWNFSEAGSQASVPAPPQEPGSPLSQSTSRRPNWGSYFQRSNSQQSQHSSSSSSSARAEQPPSERTAVFSNSALLGMINQLRQRVIYLEDAAEARATAEDARERELDRALQAFSDENGRILSDIRKLKREVETLKNRPTQHDVTPSSLSTRDLTTLVERVRRDLNISQFATRADVDAIQPPRDLPDDLVRRLIALEAEMFQSAGSIPTLLGRVEQLESARMLTAVEIGGFIFVDEAATEAWVATHRDPDLLRFAPDFVTLFLLADPKFDTVEAGLEQSAAVAKAQFSSLDVATAVLSYSIVYPSNLIKKSDKADAQQDGGVMWAPPFASHEVFEGDYNNGTRLRLKKDLTAAAKAIEAGIDYHFPASLHAKSNAVFRAQVRFALTQCTDFLDALTPLYKQIAGGGMSAKEAWNRVMIFAKQIFEDIRTVRAPNVAASTGSRIWASFRTTEILKEYQRHNWVEHPKTSAILALTSMRKEGKAIEELSSKVQSHGSALNRQTGDIKKEGAAGREGEELAPGNSSLEAWGRVDTDKLLHGEQVAVDVTACVGRGNRSSVNVRVVGDSSLSWVDVVFKWGARLDAVIVDNPQVTRLLQKRYQCPVVESTQARHLPPHGPFHGLVFATSRTLKDRDLLKDLFKCWLPADLIITVHGKLTRSATLDLVPEHDKARYKFKVSRARHSQFGGATVSVWNVIHLSRRLEPITTSALMTEEHYPQPLQASLDDTEGASGEKVTLEYCSGCDYIGTVTRHSRPCTNPPRVYDADGLAPDLAGIPSSRHWFFWVLAASVWSKKEKVLRPVKLHELFAIWDFEGKLENQFNNRKQAITMLQHRLYSPPGKLIRLIGHHLLDQRAAYFDSLRPPPHVVTNKAVKSEDVPFTPLEDLAEVRAEAACPDDAEIDLSTWALPQETPEQFHSRNVLRRFAVRWWSYYHTKKAYEWLAAGPRTKFDVMAVEDAVRRIKACRYFKWVRGSRIFYWWLPEEWHSDFRDGVKFLQLPGSVLPEGRMRNIPTETREQELLTREKIFRLRFNWYLEKGIVRLVIPRFTVPKSTDVRVVWDSKANGHNACLWAPSFILGDFGDLEEIVVKWLSVPVESYLKMGSPDQDYSQDAASFIKSWQADIDVGQQFNNFATHHEDRPYCGVRMIDTRNDGSAEVHWFARFCVLHFGGRPSPFNAGMGQQRILEWVKKSPSDISSPFAYAKVILNLPTSFTWDPSLPRVMRIREDGELASAETNYVDDIHPTARGKDKTNAVILAKFMKSRMNSVGNQADDKKYRPPTCRPGAWKGEIMHTDQPLPRKSTTTKKWVRFKDGVSWVLDNSRTASVLSTAELRRIAGLGINVTDVYKDARCYLKGFFNAVESFRANRDLNGWRLQVEMEAGLNSDSELRDDSGLTISQLETAMEAAEELELQDASTAKAAEGYPLTTKITPELISHCEALLDLFDSDTPRTVFIRPASAHSYRYYVGDASREGLGGATQFPDGSIKGRRGVWNADFAEGGSNLREAQNQVNHLIREIRAGMHDGCELWAFTDNGCWSAVWLKGLSTAKHLFELVLKLKIECRIHEVYLHVCHISGTRMIESGVDGWSRGDFDSGISLGYDLRTFLPLSLSCVDVAGGTVLPWLKSWMAEDFVTTLTPEGWFWDGHLPGTHVWTPPPAAALIALKQLARSRHKRPHDLTHVVLIPRLLYWEEWQSRFQKEMDIWFVLHAGTVWPHFAHEPLIIGLSFPMYRSYPWLLRLESEKVVEIGRALSKLSKESHLRVGHYLRKLWSEPGALPQVHRSLVC